MNPAGFMLVLLAVFLAFWAGSAWRHHKRTWADHKGAVASVKKARAAAKATAALRWITLRGVVIAGLVTLMYLGATGVISFRKDDSQQSTPASVTHTTAKPAPKATTTSKAKPTPPKTH